VVLAYVASIYKPLEAISHTVGSLQDQLANLRFAFQLLDTKADITDAPGASTLEKARGDLRFENVSFSYEDKVIIRDLSTRNTSNPTSARLLPVKAQPATVSRSWQARTVRLTAAGPSTDGPEARRSQVER